MLISLLLMIVLGSTSLFAQEKREIPCKEVVVLPKTKSWKINIQLKEEGEWFPLDMSLTFSYPVRDNVLIRGKQGDKEVFVNLQTSLFRCYNDDEGKRVLSVDDTFLDLAYLARQRQRELEQRKSPLRKL